jgi:hypothetical protein
MTQNGLFEFCKLVFKKSAPTLSKKSETLLLKFKHLLKGILRPLKPLEVSTKLIPVF